MSDALFQAPGEGESFAVTRVGAYTIGIELSRIAEFVDSGEGDVALEALLGLSGSPEAPRNLLRLGRGSEHVLLEIRNHVEMGHRLAGRCQRPALVAAALERSYLRGVLRDGDRLVYVLDVDRVARSFAQTKKDGGSA